MTLLEALALGIVQGLTEFFPVSSSGHLVLAEALLGVNPPGVSFEVFVHLATLVSVLAFYRRRIAELIRGTLSGRADAISYLGKLAVATVPAAVVGIAVSGAISGLFDMPLAAAASLLVTGAVVFSTRWLAGRGDRPSPGWLGSVAVGVAQAAALIPGISRSGITVTAALAAKTGREAAAEFSFLLSVPAILGASLLGIPELMDYEMGIGAFPLVAASLGAFAAGFAAIFFFVHTLRVGHFHRFAYYCWAVGGGYIVYALLTA
jgi:undecaprenyl-diphosphatase